MNIIRLGNEMGISFAFPTQTLHLYQEEHRQVSEPKPINEHLSFAQEKANSLANNSISFKENRSSIEKMKNLKESDIGN
jgi:MscS family membrane protein